MSAGMPRSALRVSDGGEGETVDVFEDVGIDPGTQHRGHCVGDGLQVGERHQQRGRMRQARIQFQRHLGDQPGSAFRADDELGES